MDNPRYWRGICPGTWNYSRKKCYYRQQNQTNGDMSWGVQLILSQALHVGYGAARFCIFPSKLWSFSLSIPFSVLIFTLCNKNVFSVPVYVGIMQLLKTLELLMTMENFLFWYEYIYTIRQSQVYGTNGGRL